MATSFPYGFLALSIFVEICIAFLIVTADVLSSRFSLNIYFTHFEAMLSGAHKCKILGVFLVNHLISLDVTTSSFLIISFYPKAIVSDSYSYSVFLLVSICCMVCVF